MGEVYWLYFSILQKPINLNRQTPIIWIQDSGVPTDIYMPHFSPSSPMKSWSCLGDFSAGSQAVSLSSVSLFPLQHHHYLERRREIPTRQVCPKLTPHWCTILSISWQNSICKHIFAFVIHCWWEGMGDTRTAVHRRYMGAKITTYWITTW